jgi:phosphoribosylaminoimidazolecarboxamide formyltransferase/IMP cyclohydrolase
LREEFAAKAFRRTAAYDAEIARYLSKDVFPERLTFTLSRVMKTRYGENPHQEGAVYAWNDPGTSTVVGARVLGGKELSYNNYLDASAAYAVVCDFDRPAAAIIKHRNPCGASVSDSLMDAVLGAYEGDAVSAFGGILAINRPMTVELAAFLATPDHFLEVIIAPTIEPLVSETLIKGAKWGKSVRVLEVGALNPMQPARLEVRSIDGGLLVQQPDSISEKDFLVMSARAPTDAEWCDLRFANILARHVTSNGITLVKGSRLVGVGAGQMSRVDAVKLAVDKSEGRARGACLGSDAFFPFPDGVIAAANAGVTAVIQPFGSIRDDEVLRAADDHGLAMVRTKRRHFRH